MSEDMKREINGVKARLNGIDTRLDGIDTRLDGIDSKLNGIDSEMRDTKKVLLRVAAAVTNIGSVLSDMNDFAKEKFVTKDEFHGRMDAFIGIQNEMRFDWGKHRVRLDNHDKRLTRLEGRRP